MSDCAVHIPEAMYQELERVAQSLKSTPRTVLIETLDAYFAERRVTEIRKVSAVGEPASRQPEGFHHGRYQRTSLSPEKVQRLLHVIATNPELTTVEVAKRFGVSPTTIKRIQSEYEAREHTVGSGGRPKTKPNGSPWRAWDGDPQMAREKS